MEAVYHFDFVLNHKKTLCRASIVLKRRNKIWGDENQSGSFIDRRLKESPLLKQDSCSHCDALFKNGYFYIFEVNAKYPSSEGRN